MDGSECYGKKFGLNLLDGKETPDYTLDAEFTIQKFLQDIENSPKGVFDPNAFIYLTKAMDYFDLERDYGSLSKAFSRVKGRTLLVSFDSDWRYPEEEIDKIRLAMEKNKNRWNTTAFTPHLDMGHFCMTSIAACMN